jgi:hypothetical protein
MKSHRYTLWNQQRSRTTRRAAGLFFRLAILPALLALGLGGQPAAAQTPDEPLVFTAGAVAGDAAWGDYDNDENLDLLITGTGSLGQRLTLLYRSQNGLLTPVESGLPQVETSSVDWGDFDNDGYLDVLLTGKQGFSGGSVTGLAGVYRSVPNSTYGAMLKSVPLGQSPRVFELAFALPNLYSGTGEWGDANNDGLLDILLSGYTDGGAPLTHLYYNTGSSFSRANLNGLVNLGGGSAAWGDYNNDGYLDFVVNGRQSDGAPRSLVYRANTNGGYYAPIELTGMWGGAALFFDLDNDNDLDLLLTGNRGDNDANILPTTILYRYASSTFTPVTNSGLPDVWESALSAGDVNNDGFTDLLLNGLTTYSRPTRLYLNSGTNTFVDAGLELPGGPGIQGALGDFDGNQSLDLALNGPIEGSLATVQIFVNPIPDAPANLPPAAPQLLAACWDGQNRLTLDWKIPANLPPASKGSGITYNLRMGTTIDGIEVSSPEASQTSGFFRLAQPGRLFYGTRAILRNLPLNVPYFWSVQAVDSSLAGGPFSATSSIPLGTVLAVQDTASTIEDTPVSFNVLENDSQASGPISVYWHNTPANGTLSRSGGTFTFTTNADWSGTTSFRYSAINSERYCTQADVTIQVAPVNDAPSMDPILDQTYPQWSGVHLIELSGISPGPANEASQPLSFQIDTDRPDLLHDLAITYPGTGASAVLSLRVAQGTGQAQVTVTLSDGQPENGSITRVFTVTLVADPHVYLPLLIAP